jgi:hypothetical protein
MGDCLAPRPRSVTDGPGRARSAWLIRIIVGGLIGAKARQADRPFRSIQSGDSGEQNVQQRGRERARCSREQRTEPAER